MPVFLRRYQRKLKVYLASFIAVSLLLIVCVQELADRSQYSFSRTGGQSTCPLFDAVDMELVKILEQLKPINQDDDDAKRLATAVQTLADNRLMTEGRFARRLLYLADVLHRYKDRLLMQEKGRRSSVDEDAVKRKIEDLVRIVENMTDSRTAFRSEDFTTLSRPIRIYRTNESK